MTPEQIFEENVKWLYKTIPRDDIYDFAEQCHMAAGYFMAKWAEHVDLTEEYHKSEISKIWIRNIVGLRMLREGKIDGNVNVELYPNEDLS